MIQTSMNAVEWRISAQPVAYPEAVALMEERVQQNPKRRGRGADLAAGTSVALHRRHLCPAGGPLQPDRFPVYRSGRGGQYTYHGPGQRVAYVMLDLKRRGPDLRAFVHDLEEWIIRALARFNVVAERRDGRVGLWVPRGGQREDKIAAIGVRVRRWVTYHGVAINLEPDLSHFEGIVPCGINAHGVTSLVDLGLPVTMEDLDVALTAGLRRGLQRLISKFRFRRLIAWMNGDGGHAREARSLPAGRDHFLHHRLGPGEERFDPAVGQVSHPALKTAAPGLVIDPIAKADALDPAFDQDPHRTHRPLLPHRLFFAPALP